MYLDLPGSNVKQFSLQSAGTSRSEPPSLNDEVVVNDIVTQKETEAPCVCVTSRETTTLPLRLLYVPLAYPTTVQLVIGVPFCCCSKSNAMH